MILQPAPADRIARISIRTPRAGSDSVCQNAWSVPKYFNPCSPCGERQEGMVIVGHPLDISIHAPRAGSDSYGATG